MRLSFLPRALKDGVFRILREAGLAERRCACCLAPFTPPEDGGAPLLQPWMREAEALFCPECRPSFVRREAGYCPWCGEPSPVKDAPCMPCGRCLRRLPPWDGYLFFGVHEGPLREMVLRGKFGGGLPALDALGRLLAEVCREEYSAAPLPDAIVPLPLHRKRLLARGFSQCAELCRPVSRAIGVPVRNDLLFRNTETAPQAMRTKQERLGLAQVFRASPEAAGLHILLVDDVVTTGTTMERAAECLKAAGAARVDAASVSRASMRG